MPATNVYRSGDVTVGVHTGEVAALFADADAQRPTGRAGRGNSLYASPSVFGVTRWVRGNAMVGSDITARQLRVNPAGLFAYSIDAWENASVSFGRTSKSYEAYWASGIALSEWDAAATTQGLDARKWEVLVPQDAVLNVRPVSAKRLIDSVPAVDTTRDDLVSVLSRARRSR